jgi:glycosyltransferase involved in cell wall biosynthesis
MRPPLLNVLLSSASFSPSYGGPAYSVRQLAIHLSALGHRVAMWAPDGSAVDEPASGDGEPDFGPFRFGGPLSAVFPQFGVPDIFHDSGLWWRHNRMIASTARKLERPLIVSVRGMLEPAALSHRSWRKYIAWHLYQRQILDTAMALHVTGDLEKENVRKFRLRAEIVCVPNGLSCPKEVACRAFTQPRRVIFLGRLHPIKGLSMLLDAWARIRPANWVLEIAGPDENGYRRKLENRVDALRLNGSIYFTGPVAGAEKKKLFERASLFVLPSLSENFGLAAGESLAEGVPVIATQSTPWSSLEAEGCGWFVPTSIDGLEHGLRSALATPDEKLVRMGERGHKYIARTFSWAHVTAEMTTLYERVKCRYPILTNSFREYPTSHEMR